MSELSGSLADFTLSAVIRLLSAGDKTGILVINAPTIGGSVFFDAGELAFATTRKHHQNGDALGEDRREGAPDIGDDMIADVITRLTRQGDGSFTFQADVQPVHDITTTYSVDHILEMVEERLGVWNDVLESLGSTDEAYAMTADLDPDDDVKLKGADWNVLAVLGRGKSSTQVAAALRLSDLEAAQALVRLKADGLVDVPDIKVETPAPALNGGRLHEPDPDDIVVNITDAVVASMPTDEADSSEQEEPASDLAARWRNLRSSRDEIPST